MRQPHGAQAASRWGMATRRPCRIGRSAPVFQGALRHDRVGAPAASPRPWSGKTTGRASIWWDEVKRGRSGRVSVLSKRQRRTRASGPAQRPSARWRAAVPHRIRIIESRPVPVEGRGGIQQGTDGHTVCTWSDRGVLSTSFEPRMLSDRPMRATMESPRIAT